MNLSDVESRRILKTIYKTSNLPNICMYCGEPADQREHVLPKSLVGEDTPKVWACAECNQLASDNVFDSIEEKRYFIHQKLKVKYKSFFSFPDWDKDELLELGTTLRTKILGYMSVKVWIRKRLEWNTAPLALYVAHILEKSDIGKDSAQHLAETLTITMKDVRPLLCLETETHKDFLNMIP